ncbi:MAG: hypothetical protein ABH856_04460 [Patescibacteria group bacterium]|nr:hypothetical protein [Patescibacteria group bacterium]
MAEEDQERADSTPLIERLSGIVGDDRNTVRGRSLQGDCVMSRKAIGHGYKIMVSQKKSPERRNPTITSFRINLDGQWRGSTRVMPEHVGGRTGVGYVEDAHFDIDGVLDSFQEDPGCQVLRLIKRAIGDGRWLKGETEDSECEIVKVSAFKLGGYKVTVRRKEGGNEERVYRIYGDGSSEFSCEDLVSVLKNMQIMGGEKIGETPPSLVSRIGKKIAGVLKGNNS